MAADGPGIGPDIDDEVEAAARARAGDTVATPSPEVGALLRLLARTVEARTAVEVGSAAGVSGLWLLAGMVAGGTLTSIESDRHAHELATSAFTDAGATGRVRAIVGDPAMVLPRLADAGYDLVVAQGAPVTVPVVVQHAARLLRPGGLLVIARSLRDDAALDELRAGLAEDANWTVATLPLDDGVTLARLTRDAGPGRAPGSR